MDWNRPIESTGKEIFTNYIASLLTPFTPLADINNPTPNCLTQKKSPHMNQETMDSLQKSFLNILCQRSILMKLTISKKENYFQSTLFFVKCKSNTALKN